MKRFFSTIRKSFTWFIADYDTMIDKLPETLRELATESRKDPNSQKVTILRRRLRTLLAANRELAVAISTLMISLLSLAISIISIGISIFSLLKPETNNPYKVEIINAKSFLPSNGN